jgi:uncharacterized protein
MSSAQTFPSINAPAWFSIPAKDVNRAKAFYEKVFDWNFRDSPDPVAYPPSNFAMFTTPAPSIKGGIIKVNEVKAVVDDGAVLLYLRVEDIDSAFEKVKQAGGRVVQETIPEGNHTLRAKVADTEGNVIGILKWLNH